MIPTPALSEILVHAGRATDNYIQAINGKACFQIVPFDERAAIEMAAMTKEALNLGDLRVGTALTRSQLKFDRQIIAIAKTRGEQIIYSDDKGMTNVARPLGITAIPIFQLPLPTVPVNDQ